MTSNVVRTENAFWKTSMWHRRERAAAPASAGRFLRSRRSPRLWTCTHFYGVANASDNFLNVSYGIRGIACNRRVALVSPWSGGHGLAPGWQAFRPSRPRSSSTIRCL